MRNVSLLAAAALVVLLLGASSATATHHPQTGTRVIHGAESAIPADADANDAATVARQATRRVAVTFDDLPLGGPQLELARVTVMTDELVAAISAAGVPAVGFVNEGKLEVEGEREARLDLLRRWAGAGFELGNHTHSHLSPHHVTLPQYFDDIVRGEPATRALMAEHGRRLRWFRHPFLRRGLTLDDKQAIDDFLAARGYAIAPVTMDNADYVFSAVYTDAKTRGDGPLMERVAAAYLAFSERIYAFYEQAADDLFGRPIAHVYLLHANELNAATFAAFAAMTRERGYRFITLDEAIADPAYDAPDRYAGPAGTSWLFRWDATQAQDSGARKVDWRGEPPVPAWLQDLYDAR